MERGYGRKSGWAGITFSKSYLEENGRENYVPGRSAACDDLEHRGTPSSRPESNDPVMDLECGLVYKLRFSSLLACSVVHGNRVGPNCSINLYHSLAFKLRDVLSDIVRPQA